MKAILRLGLCLGCAATISTSHAIDLKESKVTQVVNDVEIISAAEQKARPASVDDTFSMPDILRTGKSSRAELVAKDETITRVGANTVFSFDPATRTIDLKQGSLLFHSPHGKGGGTIRTGSATASVLGTTIIVTTTPDGGMKVLDLEGKVEVNFKNKKKQKLQPGQMTFILPGGNQLAPIVVFRLDELIKHSQLVHGFGQQLTSMPLIQDQINHQNKLINSGRAQDTGLVVGDRATENQVEVLDPNTVQKKDVLGPNPDAEKALAADANITGSSLEDASIPVPPGRLFLSQSFSLANNDFFTGQKFKGFAARNISFNSASPLTIDLSPFASQPAFSFVAADSINLNTSVTFDFGMLPAANQLTLIGGKQISIADGITLQADAADFRLVTRGALSLNNVSLNNHIGTLGLVSGSTINLHNLQFSAAGTSTFIAPKAVNFSWNTAAFIGQTGAADDNVIITDPTTGHVNISAGGSLTVNSTSISAHYLTLNSGDSILLDGAGHTLTAKGPGSVANFTAPNSIEVAKYGFQPVCRDQNGKQQDHCEKFSAFEDQ